MNPNVKAKWVQALRSGQYEQGDGWLHYEADGVHKFCCLGVLCELAVEEGVIPPGDPNAGQPKNSVGNYIWDYDDGNDCYLPPGVAAWADIDNTGRIDGYDLADMNDGGSTFTEIADVIEAHA